MTEWGESIGAIVVRLLGAARRERAVTMEELADRAELDRTYIGLLERGERRPTVAVAASLAAALGLSLSDILALAEEEAEKSIVDHRRSTSMPVVEIVAKPPRRSVPRQYLGDTPFLTEQTGLVGENIAAAIESAYHTFDLIDEQLIEKGSERLSQLIELANLSSILGNLLGAGVAAAAAGLYRRNRPHKYPDLLANVGTSQDLEIKTALEDNKPKGHLPKPGAYLTFRYVLSGPEGQYTRGREARGAVVSVWEVKFGILATDDFDESNTSGDSGKTAVVRTSAFSAMELVYFDPNLSPSPRLTVAYLAARSEAT